MSFDWVNIGTSIGLSIALFQAITLINVELLSANSSEI